MLELVRIHHKNSLPSQAQAVCREDTIFCITGITVLLYRETVTPVQTRRSQLPVPCLLGGISCSSSAGRAGRGAPPSSVHPQQHTLRSTSAGITLTGLRTEALRIKIKKKKLPCTVQLCFAHSLCCRTAQCDTTASGGAGESEPLRAGTRAEPRDVLALDQAESEHPAPSCSQLLPQPVRSFIHTTAVHFLALQ